MAAAAAFSATCRRLLDDDSDSDDLQQQWRQQFTGNVAAAAAAAAADLPETSALTVGMGTPLVVGEGHLQMFAWVCARNASKDTYYCVCFRKDGDCLTPPELRELSAETVHDTTACAADFDTALKGCVQWSRDTVENEWMLPLLGKAFTWAEGSVPMPAHIQLPPGLAVCDLSANMYRGTLMALVFLKEGWHALLWAFMGHDVSTSGLALLPLTRFLEDALCSSMRSAPQLLTADAKGESSAAALAESRGEDSMCAHWDPSDPYQMRIFTCGHAIRAVYGVLDESLFPYAYTTTAVQPRQDLDGFNWIVWTNAAVFVPKLPPPTLAAAAWSHDVTRICVALMNGMPLLTKSQLETWVDSVGLTAVDGTVDPLLCAVCAEPLMRRPTNRKGALTLYLAAWTVYLERRAMQRAMRSTVSDDGVLACVTHPAAGLFVQHNVPALPPRGGKDSTVTTHASRTKVGRGTKRARRA